MQAQAQLAVLEFPPAVIMFLVFPLRRIAGARAGLHVVPPHVFRALAVGPDILAGDRASMAAEAFVEVKHHRNL